MKIRSSTKIAAGFLAVVGVIWYGYNFATDYLIMGEKFTEITPGNVNIVGIDAGAGYRIIVANQIAQLVQASSDFEGKESGDAGATEGAIKRRLPMKEMLQTLQGNKEALGRFVMALNDMREDDTWPPQRIVWRAEDIKKAIAGDKSIRDRLERDINMKLDGTPLTGLRIASLENGIIVDSPVWVNVNLNGKVERLEGRVQQPYKPRLIRAVEAKYADKAVDRPMQFGYYAEAAREVLNNPTRRENVAKSLETMFSDQTAKERAEPAERVLRNARIVVNDGMIRDAKYTTIPGPDGKKFYDLTVNLNDEGRRRLWQFSKKRIGTQLLLVANGVAIAAPRIEHQLAQGQVTITQMTDEVMVREAVDMLNEGKGSRSAKL